MDPMLPPGLRKKWSSETLTYGEWLRTVGPEFLSESEKGVLAKERAWEKANPKTVAQLDALVGRTVSLRRTMKTLADGAFGGRPVPGPYSYPAGYRFNVSARMGRYLLAKAVDGTVFLLSHKWVKLVPEVPDAETPSRVLN